MGCALELTFRGSLGLESAYGSRSKEGGVGGVGPGEDRDCLEWRLLQERSLRLRQVIRVNPLSRGGAAASTGGEEAASASKAEMLISVSGLSTPSLIRLFQYVPISTYRTPFFLGQRPHLHRRHRGRLEVQPAL